MKYIRSLTFRLLAALIIIGAAAAGLISLDRYQVEHKAQTVEMVYDYENIMENAALERTTAEELFSLYKRSGVTSLAVYDEKPKKLLDHGDLIVRRGTEMASLVKTGDGEIYLDRVYIQPSLKPENKIRFTETVDALYSRLDEKRLRMMNVGGVETLEVDVDYGKFLDMDLGIFPSEVKEVGDSGFYVVLRPTNPPHVTKAEVEQFLKAVDASPKVSAVLFVGKQILGYKEQTGYLAAELKKRNVPVALIEAPTQLNFEKQDGLIPLVKQNGYHAVRLYAMPKDELVKINQEEAASRFYISDIERNIRMNLFPSYKTALNGDTLSETNAKYIARVKDRLEEHGFSVGKASLMDAYFPNPLLRSAAMTGALSLVVMMAGFLFPLLRHWLWPLWGIGFVVTQGLWWGLSSVLPLQMLALGCAVSTPVVVVSFFLEYALSRKASMKKAPGFWHVFGEGAAALWCMGLFSLAGALFVSGLLGDIRFLLEMEIFRGVKVTFVLPILLISIVYIQKFPFFGKAVTDGTEFVQFVRKFCAIPVKLGTLAFVAFLAVVGFIFVGRSGNNSGAPVPAFEIQLRRFLEEVMYARPREKEFLIGHPAVFLSLMALYRKWPQLLHYFLIVAVTIAQGSMVETFAHMRSPFILSFIRGLDGLAAGTLAGLAALFGVIVLIRITAFLGDKYDRS